MRRVPILPTLIVGLAVAAMIALGRAVAVARPTAAEGSLSGPARRQPGAARHRLSAVPRRQPAVPPHGRRLPPARRHPPRGRRGGGIPPDRHLFGAARGDAGAIGHHARSARGQPLAGRSVTGYVSHAPDGRSLLQSAFDHRPQQMLLVADTPAPGPRRESPPRDQRDTQQPSGLCHPMVPVRRHRRNYLCFGGHSAQSNGCGDGRTPLSRSASCAISVPVAPPPSSISGARPWPVSPAMAGFTCPKPGRP